jgi:heptosyltransferase II
MPASPAFASAEPPSSGTPRVLIVGVNWLGDSVMALPAVRELRRRQPAAWLAILVKPAVAAFWKLCPDISQTIVLEPGLAGLRAAAHAVHAERFDQAYVLPNSFRSALVPFLARVPVRKGAPGQGRGWMLTDAVPPPAAPDRTHQMYEYLHLMGFDDADPLAFTPLLNVPDETRVQARRLLDLRVAAARHGEEAWGPEVARVALFPGAARGSAKRWPTAHFVEVGRRLVTEMGAGILVLGTKGEAAACDAVVAGIGKRAVSLAGKLAMSQLAGVLTECRLAVANDSGGMHLAAALGVPVVGIFGITDPAKTGPIGAGHTVVAPQGVRQSRDVPRASEDAAEALRSISADAVYAAAAAKLKP